MHVRSHLTSRLLLAGFACVLTATFSACEVGTVPKGGGSGGPDAGRGGGGSDGSTAGQPDGSGGNANCDNLVTAGLPDGHHDPGQSCITAGCHDGGAADGTAYTAAGTAYKGTGTATPYAGATIHLIDANGNDIAVVTAGNGNFFTDQPVAYPVQTKISSCPYTLAMSTQVPAGQGSCNKAGCHDANLPISLP